MPVPVDAENANYYHSRMEPVSPPAVADPATSGKAAPPPVARVSSHDLLGAAGQIVITHAGRDYRLRITQNGKLILTA